MKKWIFTLMFIFSLLSLSKATVIFDPADYAGEGWTMAQDSMEIVQLDGNYYLKTFLNDWNTTLSLSSSVTIPAEETMFKCFARYAVGTSGFDVTGIKTFVQLSGGGLSSGIKSDSQDSLAIYSAAAIELVVDQIQFAGQETTGWTAVVGDTMWVSRIVSYNPDLIFQPDGHAGAFPAGTKVVEIDGASYAKVPLDDWNSIIALDDTLNSGKASSFNTMAQFAIGTSGFDLSSVLTYINLISIDGDLEIKEASSATPKLYSADFAGPIHISGIKLAGQETTGWTAVVGDTLWLGDVKTVVIDEPGVLFNPATYPESLLPAGMEIVIVGADTLLKVTTTGWDNVLPLVAAYSMGDDNNLTFKIKVEPGTSGLTQAELNYFIGGNDSQSLPVQQFTGGGASSDVAALTEINLYAKAQISVDQFQIAVQQNSGDWPAMDGVIVYIGKIKANKVETVNLEPRVTYAVPFTKGETIELDGLQLEDAWFEADAALADQVVEFVAGNPASPADNSAEWYAVYDTENLYVFADITDDVVVPMGVSTKPWENDGIEIFVDIKDRRYDLPRITSEQHQIRFNIKRDTCDASAFGDYYPKWGDVQSAASYSFEIALPWAGICQGAVDSADIAKYISDEIVGGKKISFEVSIIDADVLDTRKSILNWANNTGEDQPYNTSMYFGQLTLGGSSAVKTTNTLSAKVYPNPASGNLNVSMEGMNSVVLYNVTGQRVLNQIVESNTTILNISALRTGMYIIEVKSDQGVAIQKVTIK